MTKSDPLCTVCGKNKVPPHQMPVPPFPPVCDPCARDGQSLPAGKGTTMEPVATDMADDLV